MLAEILARHGFVPAVPTTKKQMGTPQTVVQRHVPTVPTVPTQNSEVATDHRRVIVKFRMATDPPTTQAIALGAPGLTRAEIVADLMQRYHERVVIQPEPTP